MIGAIAGDMIGSSREFLSIPIKTKDFELFTPESYFTDDSILTCAIAKSILDGGDYGKYLLDFGRKYLGVKGVGWGSGFYRWLISKDPQAYKSFGNGSGMRVSAVGWAFDSSDDVLKQAELSALPSHNHIEGIKGAQAIALSVFMARKGRSNEDIKNAISAVFKYDLDRTLNSIRPSYKFEVTCQRSVPEAIICFLEATSFEDAVRNAVSLGGDTDTQGAMAGAIAEARWGVPSSIKDEVIKRLDPFLLDVVQSFESKFMVK